jgi:cytochrome c2
MPNSKKILYGVEDYLHDRNGGKTTTGGSATVLSAPTAAAAPTQTAAPAPTQAPSNQVAPASASAPTAPAQAPSMQMGTGAAGAVSPTQPMSMSDMWKMELSNARQKVYEVMNQKFVYNEKSSPLYSILQKQYEREADRAAGQAYARSVANTGGYGSSYATLAADEARRRTMEGFDDQQLALYQAAKDEFYANRQSAIDWYNQAKQMYGDAVNEDLTNAYDEGIAAWLESGDEAAVREMLEGKGYNATTINNAITMMKEYSAEQGALDATLKDQAYTDAYNTGSSLAVTLAGQGKTEEEIRAALIAQGIDPVAVEQIMSDRLEQKASDAANRNILDTIEKNARDEAEAEEAKNAYNSWLDEWLANPDETAIRAAMQEAGISEAAINSAIIGFMEYSTTKNAYQAGVDAAEKNARDEAEAEEAKNAYNSWLDEWLANPDETAIRAAMQEAGISEAAINSAIIGFMEYSAAQNEYKAGVDAIEQNARDKAEAEEAKNAYNNWLDDWLANPDETAIRAAMQEAGISEAAINAAILGFMEYSTVKADFDKTVGTGSATGGGLTEEEKGDLTNAALGAYDGTNKGQIEEQLKQNGATQEEADEIIGKLEDNERAGLDDSAKLVSDITSAVDHKDELDTSLKNGTLSVEEYDRRVAENSTKIMKEITPNLDDMSEIDYEALGIPKAEWEAMDDADKKLTVLASVGELVKEGIVTHADYERMLTADTRELFASKEYKNSKTPIRDAVDRAVVIKDLREDGYLLEDEYIRLLYEEIAPKFENTQGFKYLVGTWNTYKDKDDASAKKFFKYATGTGIMSGVNATLAGDFANLSADQQDMVFEMVKFIANRMEKEEKSTYSSTPTKTPTSTTPSTEPMLITPPKTSSASGGTVTLLPGGGNTSSGAPLLTNVPQMGNTGGGTVTLLPNGGTTSSAITHKGFNEATNEKKKRPGVKV